MLDTLEGLDHVVIVVRDLDAAAQQWRSLGFTVSPRGTHSAHLGTGNYTVMFEDDYLELLGVLSATELNAASRAFLDRRVEGIECAAFRTTDAQGTAASLAARGIAAGQPVHFSRPVQKADGTTAEAAFSVVNWPAGLRPADLRIFACQHHTREAVWIPALVRHPNTVTGIARLEVLATNPATEAAALARLIDGTVRSTAEGERLQTGRGHADILFLTREAFAAGHGIPLDEVPAVPGAAALVLRVRDWDAAVCQAGSAARVSEASLVVPTTRATGVTLVFQRG